MAVAVDTALMTADVARTARLIAPHIVRTPLLRSATEPWGTLHLKCENLQRTNSFKFRGAVSSLLHYRLQGGASWERILQHGVITCSTGNFGRAIARVSQEFDLGCTIVVPEAIPVIKLNAILAENPNAEVIKVPYEEWRHAISTSKYPGTRALFLSSEINQSVSLGNATIAMEVLRDLPDVDAILVPYGGGNLAYSIASYLQAAGRDVPVFAVEVSTGAPLTASLRAGRPTDVEYRPSFVDGIGASFVIPEQFHRVKDLIAGTLVISPEDIAEALASLAFTDKIVSEGAGAAAPAAASKYANEFGWKRACAVVSGGAIEPSLLLDTLTPHTDPITRLRSAA
ncbi:pyridoxal-phosphate dependent enzyme [Streptomyces sp. NPDC088752]|uniref:threonine ammonia-lyase n=1 Tax=Streptomyces sp. NPDC088752 TaxID=3154963 RepID=UPI00342FDA85